MNTLKVSFFALLLTFGLTACNTTRGVGQDIEAAGDTIENAAESAKESLSDDND